MAEYINAPTDLQGPDLPPPTVRRWLSNPESPAVATTTTTDYRPKTVTTFDGAVPELLPEAPVPVRPIRGSAGMVRAERIATQHEDEYWTAVLPVTVANGAPLDATAVDQQYTDLVLGSYLPEALLPTIDEFRDFADPARRKVLLTRAVARAGVLDDTSGVATRGSAAILPAQVVQQPAPFQSSPYPIGCKPFYTNSITV